MNRRSLISVGAAATLAASAVLVSGTAATGVAGASTGHPASTHRTVMRHFTVTRGGGTALDLGAKGPSLGDQEVEYGNLVENGHVVGHQALLDQVVSIVKDKRESLHMTFDLTLPGGQITAAGLATFGRTGNPVTVPVTGGTGTYRGAAGELTLRPGQRGFAIDLVLVR
jgi:hypothetical protein